MKIRNLMCCQPSFWCVTDNVLHILRIKVRRICDRHDRIIMGG